ncbi:MAG: hypothetical protein SF162_01900 [bacterium]|nr:hypothetical protein [bacterium]
MTYFMRFIYASGGPLTLGDVQSALQADDPLYTILGDAADPEKSGDLMRGEDVYGEIELNSGTEVVFREDIQELLEDIEGSEEIAAPAVRRHLESALGMVVLRVGEFGHIYAERLDALWDWLFETRGGLLQVDGEGYYDIERLILPVESGEDD